jgi:hypothetical protein
VVGLGDVRLWWITPVQLCVSLQRIFQSAVTENRTYSKEVEHLPALEDFVGALTVSPLPRWRLRLLPLPILLAGSLGCHFQIRLPRVARGLRRKGWRDLASLGLFKGDEGEARILLGIQKFLGGLKIGSTDFTRSYRGVK